MQKLVLVLNCGSSSLKFAILDAENGEEQLSGLAECLHLDDARIKIKFNGEKNTTQLPPKSAHKEAIGFLVDLINQNQQLADDLIAVGHRVVHGGEKFTHSVLIDDAVIEGIKQVSNLAPLHNPANLLGITTAQAAFPHLPQIAVFDTAFHQTMPEEAYLYALPRELYTEHGIRRYGFHGTSHLFITRRMAEILDKPVEQTNVIICHLGNGASVCAVKGGQSVDTSMGMTPLEGLVMGTRCGDIDPAIPDYLIKQLGYSVDQVNDTLNKKSGLLGLTGGESSDARYTEDGYLAGNEAAVRTMNASCYRLAKYIASYGVALDQVDAIVFTGGIGENGAPFRANVMERLQILGVKMDEARNKEFNFGKEGMISSDDSQIPAYVVPTNEELVIAQDSAKLANA